MNTISIDAAVALTGMSRSTLWRRAADGSLEKGGKDVRGRATLELDGVLELAREYTRTNLSAEDVTALLAADAGDAAAQADIGAMLYVARVRDAALYWLRQAAEQGNAEAMQWLGMACATGAPSEPADINLALMWIARAAAQGNGVARIQIEALLAPSVRTASVGM